MATDKEILQVFALLKANYHHALRKMTAGEISDLQVLWCELLRDVEGDVLRAAALKHASTSKWFPTVAELRDAAFAIAYPQRPTAMEAWGEVARQVRSVGSWDKPAFGNPITRQLVTEMGWLNLCVSDCPGADRARFIQAYDQLTAREKDAAMELPAVSEVRRRLQAATEGRRIEAPPVELVVVGGGQC